MHSKTAVTNIARLMPLDAITRARAGNSFARDRLRAGLLFLSALVCLAVAPSMRAVDPQPDGGYPGGNTAEGDKALYTLSTGTANTAVGYTALRNDTSGSFNTAMGRQALFTNTAGGFNTAVGNTALSLNTGNYNTAKSIANQPLTLWPAPHERFAAYAKA